MADDAKTKEDDSRRAIGRWYIGETLGKGGYSWVKRGIDKKTGKIVALKFMSRADDSWADEQSRQVTTEIESLKKVRHKHVLKLYAYNLNTKYPTKDGKEEETILLVLEFAPCGELFDILYYTSALEPILARTYFKQLMEGLEACHNAGVVHRDLKPQNLLLDGKYNLKITDFGLSRVFHSDKDSVMKTTYVGTRGYQAPELLLGRPYDLSCDIFSAGVILFILLTGYPPFEQAHKSDRWFRPLAKGEPAKFWAGHTGCSIEKDALAQNLVESLLAYSAKNRLKMSKIKEHDWLKGDFLEGKKLVKKLKERHRLTESKRRSDAKKQQELMKSQPSRPVPDIDKFHEPCLSYPSDETEGIMDVYGSTDDWRKIYNAIYDVVCANAGHAVFNFDTRVLTSTMKVHTGAIIAFEAVVYKSRKFESVPSGKNPVYAVRFRRTKGDVLLYRDILKGTIILHSSRVLSGLPEWARELESHEKVDGSVDATALEDGDEDYDAILAETADIFA